MNRSKGSSTISKQELAKHFEFKSFESLYKLGDEIGEGAFGVVYKCERLSDNKNLAVKALKTNPTQNDIEECLFLAGIKDKSVLHAEDFFINTDWPEYHQLVTVTELAMYDLEQYIKSLNEKNMKEEEIKQIAAQVVIALSFLHHEKKITHRDLKPANILIFPNWRVKLSDFGLAKETQASKATMTMCGTMMFAAPEILGVIAGAKPLPFITDIYSFAATICFMALKQIPDSLDIYKKTIEFPAEYSQEFKDFVYFCLVRKPEDRPNIT